MEVSKFGKAAAANRVIQTEPSADVSVDTTSPAFANQDPENKYRQTLFAPGAAVNTKHQVGTPQNFARNPKIEFPTLDPHRVSKRKPEPVASVSKGKRDKPKKEDCNIF